MSYRVIVSKTAAKAIARLPDDVQERVLSALSLLELDPFHPRLDIKNLKGKLKSLLRVRTGNYRIIYEIDHAERIVRVRQVLRSLQPRLTGRRLLRRSLPAVLRR